jgi:hypothetical protein
VSEAGDAIFASLPEERKQALANVLDRDRDGIAFNHYGGDGAIIFKQAWPTTR